MAHAAEMWLTIESLRMKNSEPTLWQQLRIVSTADPDNAQLSTSFRRGGEVLVLGFPLGFRVPAGFGPSNVIEITLLQGHEEYQMAPGPSW